MALDILSEPLSDDLTAFEDEGRGSPRVSVLSSPLTYDARLVRDKRSPNGFRAIELGDEKRSYIADLINAERTGDSDAQERLERHGREMADLGKQRALDLVPGATYEQEQRAVNWTAGTGGNFAPPGWLNQYFVTAPRAGRVFAAQIPTFDLPVGFQSINVPRLTTGTLSGVISQNSEDDDRDIVDAAVSSGVVTISGNEDVPLQLLEQSPPGAHLDFVVFTDMIADYDQQLEYQLLNGAGGTGPNAQLLGLLNNLVTAPYNATVTYPDATPTASKMFPYLGQTMAVVGKNRRMPPEFWMMNTSRTAWIASSEDTQNRPLILTDLAGSGRWDLLTVEVLINDAILPTYGAGGNQDVIIACRPSDWMLLESELHTDVYFEVLSGTLEARCQLRRYVAALERQPTSSAALEGTGMVVQANF